jgi:hypothetical protein
MLKILFGGAGFLFDTSGRLCQDSIRMSKGIWNNMALNIGENRVPVAIAMDAVRGPAFLFDPTLFPHNLGLAATWNLTLAEKQGEITGRDLRSCGWHVAMAPAADKFVSLFHGRHRTYLIWFFFLVATLLFGEDSMRPLCAPCNFSDFGVILSKLLPFPGLSTYFRVCFCIGFN